MPKPWINGSTDFGVLYTGESAGTTRALTAGTTHMVAVQCEPGDCLDVFLHVYDPAGALVIESLMGSDFADVTFEAAQTGDYAIDVSMVGCSADPCFFGVEVYSPPSP